MLDSQERMLARVKAMLGEQPRTQVLPIEHGMTLAEPRTVEKLARLLGGRPDVAKMAAAVEL